MSETITRYLVGEDARLRVRFYEEDGTTPLNPSGVQIIVRQPAPAETVTYSGVQLRTDGIGSFFVDHRVTVAGRHYWRGECAGPSAGVDEGEFDARNSRVMAPPAP